MKGPSIKNVVLFYLNGFREMRIGKTLWLIILIKLFIIFVILRIFFFKPYLNQYDTPEQKQEHVSQELIDRGIS